MKTTAAAAASIAALLLFACASDNAVDPSSEEQLVVSSTRPPASIQRYFHSLAALDAAGWASAFSNDATFRDPAVQTASHELTGRGSLEKFFQGVGGLLCESRGLTVEGGRGADGRYVYRWVNVVTGGGGRVAAWTGETTFELDPTSGLVRLAEVRWDPGLALSALGVTDPTNPQRTCPSAVTFRAN